MRPYPEEVLRALQAGIAAHFAPELQSNYARAQFAFASLLFMIVQRDYDSAVPDLDDANRALRSLLEDARAALSAVATDAARDAIAALTLSEPAATLKLSDLRRENDALRAALVALVPVIEPAADDDALAAIRPVRDAIYAHLKADAKRRVVPILSA